MRTRVPIPYSLEETDPRLFEASYEAIRRILDELRRTVPPNISLQLTACGMVAPRPCLHAAAERQRCSALEVATLASWGLRLHFRA